MKFILMCSSTFLAGVLIGSLTYSKQPAAMARPDAIASYPEELLRVALSERNADSSSSRRQDSLLRIEGLQAAATRLWMLAPNRTSAMWQEISAAAPAPSSHLADQTQWLEELLAFRAQLYEALTHASTPAEFDAIWSVREEVIKRLSACRAELRTQLAPHVPRATPVKEKEPRLVAQEIGLQLQGLEEFVRLQEERLVLFVDQDVAETLDPLIVDLVDCAKVAAQNVSGFVTDTQTFAKSFRARLSDLSVEPAEASATGPLHERRELLGQIEQQTVACDVARWSNLPAAFTIVKPRSTAAKEASDNLAKEFREAVIGLSECQALAYNLWALREIQAAETSDAWESRLAPLDTGLLEATVGALYSSVYARRIDKVTDPERRSRIVQGFLTAKHTTLRAF